METFHNNNLNISTETKEPIFKNPYQEKHAKEDGGVLKIFIITILIAICIRIFVAQPFVVNGESMVPTFEHGDYLIVDELSYRFTEPKRGEVIVFRFPQNPSKFFIKRIVGLPNETLEIKNNSVTVTHDGKTLILNEEYIKNYITQDKAVILGDNEYFVMGDNRDQSSDSRMWGPVNEELVIGRVLFRFLPITQIGIFPGKIVF